VPASSDYEVIGSTGLNIWNGQVQEEYLRELTGSRWLRIVREMRDQDPVVGATLFAIEMLIRQVKWELKPAGKGRAAKQAAEHVSSCLHDMSNTWNDTISEILTFLPYGWAFFEIVYKRREGESDNPETRSNYDDGKIGWRKLAIRAQDTLSRWEMDGDGGIRGMWQQTLNGAEVLIPIEKALLFRTTTQRGNPEGRSILRNAYRPWYFKKHIENIEGIGIERDLAGLPVAYVPPDIMRPDADVSQKAVYEQIKRIVVNIRRDAQEGVIFPMSYDDKGNLRYELKLLSSGGSRQFDTDKIITRYDQRIAMTVLADFILLGHDKVGSFALSSDKTDMFVVAIPRLVKLNGWTAEDSPTLEHSDIESVDLNEISGYIKNLVGSGASLFPNPAMERWLLAQAGVPVPEGSLPSEQEPEEEPLPPGAEDARLTPDEIAALQEDPDLLEEAAAAMEGVEE
jgi:hypothetical protein